MSDRPTLRLGLVKLTDAAPLIIAKELGLFAAEALDVELLVEPSWANVADKLTYGLIDGAVMLPPLAFAITLGLRGAAHKLIVPLSISLGGNTVSLGTALADPVLAAAGAHGALAAAQAFARVLQKRAPGSAPTLAVVHTFSTHNLLLRYWLSAGGVDPERQVELVVIPPARVVDALKSGRIDGFCAGPPWGDVAARAGLARTVTQSHEIWQNGPEKVFALSAAWAEEHPETLQALLRALLRAARYCDAPSNAGEVAGILSQARYLGQDIDAIKAALPGGSAPSRASVFQANAANFPFRSHAQWFLHEMARWHYLDPAVDARAVAEMVYRPDLYASAAQAVGLAVPIIDRKPEGAHDVAWQLEAQPEPIAMGADRFCDGKIFAQGL
jgi:NitT/TauT family transport system ATP-binding protein/nitrate/nitrite transport system substrate-binding protein